MQDRDEAVSYLYQHKVFSPNAAKVKKKSSHAPHLYQQKADSTNATSAKNESALLLISIRSQFGIANAGRAENNFGIASYQLFFFFAGKTLDFRL